MGSGYEQEKIYCVICGNQWILKSDKEINDIIHTIWLKKVFNQHKIIIEGGAHEQKN